MTIISHRRPLRLSSAASQRLALAKALARHEMTVDTTQSSAIRVLDWTGDVVMVGTATQVAAMVRKMDDEDRRHRWLDA